jgi:hypothetical protein
MITFLKRGRPKVRRLEATMTLRAQTEVANFSKVAAFLSVERYSGHEAERREVLSCRGAEVPEGRRDG